MSKSRRTLRLTASLGCVALIVLTSQLALADIQAGKYGKSQVFDCQRSPAFPTSGVSFTADGFADPSGYTLAAGDYIQLVQVNASPCSHAIDLFDSNGVLIMRLESGGQVYGLDAVGFLHVNGVTGTFVTNGAGYALGGSVTYTPTVGLASCAQLAAYVPSTTPLAAPTAGANIPTLSEWGMIIFAGMMSVLAFAAMRRSNSLTPG